MPGKKIIRKWARRSALAFALAGAAWGTGKVWRAAMPEKEKSPIAVHSVERKTQVEKPTIKSKENTRERTIVIPNQALHFSQIPKGNYCAMYARLSAKKLFGLEYVPGDAWSLSARNKSVWKRTNEGDHSYIKKLKQGQIVGIYNPSSQYNSSTRPYTHVGIYLGQKNGNLIIMHRVGTRNVIQGMNAMFSEHPGWKIMELIEPKRGL